MSRRAKGEGTIVERAGRYMGQLSITVDGQRVRKTVYAATKQEAADKLRAVRAEIAAGRDVRRPDALLKEYLPVWLQEQTHLRPSTHRLYARCIDKYLVPQIGHIKLSKLTAPHVRTLLAHLGYANVGARTIQQVYQVLRTALDQALRDGLVVYNAASRVDRPSAPTKAQGVLDATQVACLLLDRDSPCGPLWALLAGTGLRRGEALALRWTEVDLAGGWLTVTASLDARSGQRQTPKTAAGTRRVPLAPFVVDALQRRQQAQVVQRAHARFSGKPWPRERDTASTRLVFTNEVGGPLWPSWVDRQWRATLEGLGLPHISLHGLRRSFATLLRAAGVEMALIGALLGHRVGSVTERYAQPTDAMKRQAVQRLADVLAAEPTREGQAYAE